MTDRIWYAVQVGKDDNDWDYGSYDYDQALELAERMAAHRLGDQIRIAVINQGDNDDVDPLCIDEIIVHEEVQELE